MLKREFLEEHGDGVIFYRIYSDTEGKGVLQVETGIIYGEVAVTDTDPYTYEECDLEEDDSDDREEEDSDDYEEDDE